MSVTLGVTAPYAKLTTKQSEIPHICEDTIWSKKLIFLKGKSSFWAFELFSHSTVQISQKKTMKFKSYQCRCVRRQARKQSFTRRMSSSYLAWTLKTTSKQRWRKECVDKKERGKLSCMEWVGIEASCLSDPSLLYILHTLHILQYSTSSHSHQGLSIHGVMCCSDKWEQEGGNFRHTSDKENVCTGCCNSFF